MCKTQDRIEELEAEKVELYRAIAEERKQREEAFKLREEGFKLREEALKFRAEELKMYSEAYKLYTEKQNHESQTYWRPWQIVLIPLLLGVLALVAAIAK